MPSHFARHFCQPGTTDFHQHFTIGHSSPSHTHLSRQQWPPAQICVHVPLCARSSKGNKPAHFKSAFQKKQVVLGLLAVLGNTPDAALPAELATGLPQLLSGLVRMLADLREQQDAAAQRAESEEEDEGPVSGDGAGSVAAGDACGGAVAVW